MWQDHHSCSPGRPSGPQKGPGQLVVVDGKLEPEYERTDAVIGSGLISKVLNLIGKLKHRQIQHLDPEENHQLLVGMHLCMCHLHQQWIQEQNLVLE
ncbi:hypothetical protein Y1Q_0011842 [Alligator mississippiensis]|uniref:Uncharacterized protein n=1 Tax=Alligator mississippiensis TaxID=8496 RepID=A0A151LYM3_ALLMI|nr:hypothetical protein Y1Q_0011842 [Alligator mississippiensis]